MKRYFSIFLFCLIFSTPSFSQKVKYKDLFVLLYAKQYDQAEPFLKRYLKDNNDNPNAFLFMGFIYQEKSIKSDVLKENANARMFADSAIFFLDGAYKGITEKEIKRNDEYYQGYNRRDLRTGEFGTKISDVQLDIEKRSQSMKDRVQRLGLLKEQFEMMEKMYLNATEKYEALTAEYANEKSLVLRSDEKTIVRLNTLASTLDSCVQSFNSYKATLALLGKTAYNQSLNLKDIHSFKKDGTGTIDFYKDDLPVWNYKDWALGMVAFVENDVMPFKEKLVAYDIEINKLRDRIKKDSVALKTEIALMKNKLSVNPLQKYDANPMPLELFRLKLAELDYATIHLEGRMMRDTSDLILRMDAFQRDFQAIDRMDSLAIRLIGRELEQDLVDYQAFVVNAYGTSNVLTSMIKATKDFADHERMRKELLFDKARKSLEWLVVDSDSISLVQLKVKGQKYYPLVVHPEKYMVGLKFGADSIATGYFYTITHSRVPDVKINFAVDKSTFSKKNLPVIKALASKDEGGQFFFSLIYSETKSNNMFPATIAKIDKNTGLAWTHNYKFEFPPSELILTETGDLTVKIASPGGESKIVTIDKNGKQL